MQEMQLDGVALAVGRALDVADLVDPHSLGQNSVGRAEALPDLERADQCRAGLCLGRQAGVGFEHDEGNFEVGQRERGGETDRPGADDGDGILGLQGERAAVHRHIAATPLQPARSRRTGKQAQDCPANFFHIGRVCRQQKHRIRNFNVSIYFRKSVQFPIVELCRVAS